MDKELTDKVRYVTAFLRGALGDIEHRTSFGSKGFEIGFTCGALAGHHFASPKSVGWTMRTLMLKSPIVYQDEQYTFDKVYVENRYVYRLRIVNCSFLTGDTLSKKDCKDEIPFDLPKTSS